MDKFITRKRKHDSSDEKIDAKKQNPVTDATVDGTSAALKIEPENDSSAPETEPLFQFKSEIEDKKDLKWREIRGENLNCDYCVLYNRTSADKLLQEFERTLTYNEGQLARVNIFGKWHNIPRKQVIQVFV